MKTCSCGGSCLAYSLKRFEGTDTAVRYCKCDQCGGTTQEAVKAGPKQQRRRRRIASLVHNLIAHPKTSDTMKADTQPPRTENMLLDLHATAVLCGITWAKAIEMAVEGELPRPLIVSGLARWRRSDLQEWVAAGCPAIAPMAFDVDDLDGEEFRFVHAVHREFCKQPGCESEEA